MSTVSSTEGICVVRMCVRARMCVRLGCLCARVWPVCMCGLCACVACVHVCAVDVRVWPMCYCCMFLCQVRLLQEATAGTLRGATVNISPEGLPGLLSMLSVGSGVFAGMRADAVAAINGMSSVVDSMAPVGSADAAAAAADDK